MPPATSQTPNPPPPPPPRPVPTLDSLPDPAQAIIAACLPDGDEAVTRLRLSLVCKAMKELHGGTLTALTVNWGPNHRPANLTRLLKRQPGLKTLTVRHQGALPALIINLAQGCLAQIEELTVELNLLEPATATHVRTLVSALEVPGALQAVEKLRLHPTTGWYAGMLPLLTRALASDAAPALRILDLKCAPSRDEDLEALAAMLEARAQRPACRSLDMLAAEWLMALRRPEAFRCRLLRAQLQTVRKLEQFTWDPAYDACFVAAQPPRLEELDIGLDDATPAPSLRMWESMPVLEALLIKAATGRLVQNGKIEHLASALDRGTAFQQLKQLRWQDLDLAVSEWSLLLGALAKAPCASQLTIIDFSRSNLRPESMATFSDLVAMDRFPMLEILNVSNNQGIGDDGVCALVEALLTAPHTRLMSLNARLLGMSDKGMAALARVVRAGRFERLEYISLGNNEAVTDRGVCEFARAVEAAGRHGLPLMTRFWASTLQHLTGFGLGVLAHVLIKSCPRLAYLNLSENKDAAGSHHASAQGMVAAAGCKNRLTVIV